MFYVFYTFSFGHDIHAKFLKVTASFNREKSMQIYIWQILVKGPKSGNTEWPFILTEHAGRYNDLLG